MTTRTTGQKVLQTLTQELNLSPEQQKQLDTDNGRRAGGSKGIRQSTDPQIDQARQKGATSFALF